MQNCDTYVQTLNDGFTNPSGRSRVHLGEAAEPAPAEPRDQLPA